MTFSDNNPWMLVFVLCYFLTILCVKTSLSAPIFTNSLSHRVGKRWQDLNLRNKGWVWCRNYPFLKATYNTVSKRLEEYPKQTEWGGVCLPCAQLSKTSQKMLTKWILKSWISTPWFRTAEKLFPSESSPQPSLGRMLKLLPGFSLCSARWCLPGSSILISPFLPSQVQEQSFWTWGRKKEPFFTQGWGAGRIFIPKQVRITHIFMSSVICICLTCSLKAL